MRKLYRFHRYQGRQGTLRGIFIEEEEDVEKAIGREIYFGEVLGKHSEVIIDLCDEDITELTDDQSFIDKFEEIIGGSGFNPLQVLRDRDEWEEEEEDE